MASNIQIEIAADVQKAVQGIDALVQRLDKMQKETEESKKSFTAFSASVAAITTAINNVVGISKTVFSIFGNLTEAFSGYNIFQSGNNCRRTDASERQDDRP